MDIDNAVIRLCLAGSRAEFAGRIEEARALYRQAWETAEDDFEACIAAHYVARRQARPQDALHWNQIALDRALAANDARVESFYPSLYVNMGHSHELLGNREEAGRYYALAGELGLIHRPG